MKLLEVDTATAASYCNVPDYDTDGIKAVSYTHLDVYKRQGCARVLIRRACARYLEGEGWKVR